jgi:hypothetical protein
LNKHFPGERNEFPDFHTHKEKKRRAQELNLILKIEKDLVMLRVQTAVLITGHGV